MAIYKLGDKAPTIHGSSFIADGATVIGDVVLKENTSVWPGAVVRGDNEPVHIGVGSNVQDGAVLHARHQAMSFNSFTRAFLAPIANRLQ